MIREIRRHLRAHQQAHEALVEAQFVIQQANRTILLMARNYAELAVAWRLSIEKPEIDLRDDVDKLVRTSLDEVARLEEHVT